MTGPKPTDLCRGCGVELVSGSNWPPSRVSRRNRICTPCFSKKTREWEANNRERHREANNRRNRKLNATAARRTYNRERARKARNSTARRDSSGWVYGIYNEAWPGLIKVGHSNDLNNRLRQYQTSSPHRDYRLAAAAQFDDRLAAERALHEMIQGLRVGRTEWFQLHPDDLRQRLIGLTKQENQ